MGIWADDAERERLRDALTAAWPDGSAPKLSWLAEGFGSAAFESGDGLVVLAAKNAIGAQSRHVTTAMTPLLSARVPVAIPHAVWSVEEAPGLAFGAYAYPKLPGRPWTLDEAARGGDTIAQQIAGFLRGVHTYPVERALDVGIPSFDDLWADIVSLRAFTANTVREHFSARDSARIEAWWDGFLSDSSLQEAPRCLVHGDLWLQNLLVDDERPSSLLAVVDFGDLAVVDTAYDFAPLLEPGGDVLETCRRAYEGHGTTLDSGFEHRLNRWWQLRSGSWYGIRAAVRAGDEAELHANLHELRISSILDSSRLEKC
jgi:aminoglycoside phosphotransferase (APT) family kinase protein